MNADTTNLTALLDQQLRQHPVTRHTANLSRRLLAVLAKALHREPTIDDLKLTTMELVIRVYQEAGGKPSSINSAIGRFFSLWNYAHDLRLCQWPSPSPQPHVDPVKKTVVMPDRLPRGRKLGARRPGAMTRPKVTKLDGTLWSYFVLHYARQVLFGKSPQTVRLYGYTFDYFRHFLEREPRLKDLTDENLMRLMEWITQERGKSIRTANKTRDQLLAFWRFLSRKGIMKVWPDVPAMIEPQRTPIAWDEEELGQLWEMLEMQRGTIAGIPADKYWLALFSVAYDSLERIGAIRQLRWSDVVSPDCKWIHFRAETRKGRRKDSTAKMHDTTAALLCSIRAPGADLIFPWDRDPSYFHTKFKLMREKGGLPTDRYHSFHSIRRTAASFAEAAGADASKLLGHSSRRVTVDHYLDPRLIPQIHGADILPRPNELKAS